MIKNKCAPLGQGTLKSAGTEVSFLINWFFISFEIPFFFLFKGD